MKSIFILLKIVTGLATISGIYFASHFWLGNEEDWQEAMHADFTGFFTARLGVTILTGSLFFLISVFLNRLFRKTVKYRVRNAAIEYVLIVVISIVWVRMTMTT